MVGGKIEFASRCLAGVPVAPFGVATSSGSDAVAHGLGTGCGCAVVVSGSGMLGDCGGFSDCSGIAEDGDEAGAFEIRWVGKLAELVKGGEEIDQLSDG